MREFKFTNFAQGLNNVFREDRLQRNVLRGANNVDLSSTGAVQRRRGYQQLIADTGFEELYATERQLFMVANNALYVTSSPSELSSLPTALISGLADGPYDFTAIDDRVFLSDGRDIYAVRANKPERLEFGVRGPGGVGTLSAASEGGWYAGTYLVNVTFVTETGWESGTPISQPITLTEGQGIRFTDLPVSSDPDTAQLRIYVSDANGEALYARTTIPNGTSSYTLGYKRAGKRLTTILKDTLPGGTTITNFAGRLWVADGKAVLISEPANYALYDLNTGYLLMEDDVENLCAVGQGVFAFTAQNVVFIGGDRVNNMTRREICPYPAIPGTGTVVDGKNIDPERLSGRDVAVWWCSTGTMMVGLPDGSVQRVRDGEVSVSDYEEGMVAELEREGVRQLVSVLKNPKSDSSLAASDSVAVQVYRNGIELS